MNYLSAGKQHLEQLMALEAKCFKTDRMSRRSMKRFIEHNHAVFEVAECNGQLVGYALVLFHRGTRLARLYSIAVDPDMQGRGIASQLMKDAEKDAIEHGALYLRLEVNQHNHGAISLYKKFGYREFGLLHDYYEDHADALRMQKQIRTPQAQSMTAQVPWYRQTTDFTCGPAALMMAMGALDKQRVHTVSDELAIWREATTIFMTSGHGGCHPLGLAIAAVRRNFNAEVWINQTQPLFVDGVRDTDKKAIIAKVHEDYEQEAAALHIDVEYANITQERIADACRDGEVVLVLISTFRLDSKKAPHWVVVSGVDEKCFYLHDPDPDDKHQDPLDCQYIPIARQDFEKMSQFGSSRLRTAIILSR